MTNFTYQKEKNFSTGILRRFQLTEHNEKKIEKMDNYPNFARKLKKVRKHVWHNGTK